MLSLILLLQSLFLANPSADQTLIDATISSYSSELTAGTTVTYDPSTGDATVTNPDGSIIVIDPSETN